MFDLAISDGALTAGVVINLIWLIAMFFVPFTLFSIKAEMKKANKINEDLLLCAQGLEDETFMIESHILDKYKIENKGFMCVFEGKNYPSARAAIKVARVKAIASRAKL